MAIIELALRVNMQPAASLVVLVALNVASFPLPLVSSGFVDPVFLADVRALLPRIFELSELLVNRLGVVDVGAAFPHSVAYHPSCHSVRVLHLGDKPTRLLRAVHGLTLIDIPNKEQCCGFGGTFAVKNADVSGAMLAEKQANILATGAEVVTAVDNSCLMHIYGGLHRAGSKIRTLHLAEILASQERAQ
jgi:L-lactate dehydrogenase complex protein LldE